MACFISRTIDNSPIISFVSWISLACSGEVKDMVGPLTREVVSVIGFRVLITSSALGISALLSVEVSLYSPHLRRD